MHHRLGHRCLQLLLLAASGSSAFSLASSADAPGSEASRGHVGTRREAPAAQPGLDRSSRKRIGMASIYARNFAGRRMADGTRLDPNANNAASKTLPLGTEAKVTNLNNGRSATVVIQDRGPHVKGRIVDLSPSTARKLGITPKEGVAKVEVDPIALPRRE